MTTIASKDLTVEGSDGLERKIVKGTEVPPGLLSAYLDATGEEAPEGEPPVPEGTVVATQTVDVKGPDGLARKVVEGTAVPAHLQQAYAEATGEELPEAEGASAEKRFASDAAEEAALDAGLELDELKGTGKDGTVTVADVKAAAEE